jgi:peptide/nickel transport system substrate-binding protein
MQFNKEADMKRISSLITLALFGLLLCIFPSSATAGDQIKIATWEDISTFDPGWMTSAERELIIMSSLYNGLVKYKEGSWDIVPDLAESWDVAPDGKSIVFHLRKNVQFHKGFGEMSAEDVKFSLDRIVDPKAEAAEKGTWKLLDNVEVVDKYTVKIILKEKWPTCSHQHCP